MNNSKDERLVTLLHEPSQVASGQLRKPLLFFHVSSISSVRTYSWLEGTTQKSGIMQLSTRYNTTKYSNERTRKKKKTKTKTRTTGCILHPTENQALLGILLSS
mmetsp:Transcript_3316/g.5590  ORF Transcript_3316/g.5590 Transcript_3316/m.5590 type:complete len:104 (+) Transcript_3316:1430-1741(+)